MLDPAVVTSVADWLINVQGIAPSVLKFVFQDDWTPEFGYEECLAQAMRDADEAFSVMAFEATWREHRAKADLANAALFFLLQGSMHWERDATVRMMMLHSNKQQIHDGAAP